MKNILEYIIVPIGILKIVLFILGFVGLYRWFQIRKVKTPDEARVSPEIFGQWRALKMRSNNMFLIGSFGWYSLSIINSTFLPKESNLGVELILALCSIALLVYSVVYSSRASNVGWSVTEFQLSLSGGAPPPKVLAGVVVGNILSDYGNKAKSRPGLFAFDPAEISGLAPEAILVKIGWTREQITKSAGKDVKIALFEVDFNNFMIVVPTWEAMKNISLSDPEMKKVFSEKGLLDKLESLFKEIKEKGPEGKLSTDALDLISQIESQYGISKLFTGKGHTKTFNQEFGVREWLIRPMTEKKSKVINWNHEPFRSINIIDVGSL